MSRAYYNYILTREMQTMERKLHRRSIRDASNPFEFPENEFRRLFRINKSMALYLCEELNGALQPQNTLDGLPVHIKVLASVRLMADGSYQRGTGQDHGLAIAQTTVSKYLTQVTEAIISILMPKWIIFPGTEDARRRVANGFQQKHGLPDILGAIDCTHVDIFPPPFPTGVQYKNRKGRTTINVQLVVDVNCRILSINARYPGRVHDQFIFNNSNLKREMRPLYDNGIGQYYLLGDSGYALEPWLMTPDLDAAPNSAGDKYTQWHCQVRNCVERANGYVKGTFRCLGIDRVLHYGPEKASKIIYSCATIYNIMHHYRVPLDTMEPISADEAISRLQIVPDTEQTNLLRLARTKRELLINRYFN